MRQLRRRFQYRVNRIFTRGSWVQFALLGVVASLVVLLGSNARFLGLFSVESLAAEGIDDDLGGGFQDSFFWALKHVMDPGAFAENYGAPFGIALVALILSVLGLSILGVLIGFITNLVQRRVAAIERGNTPVVEEGHTLLLGWNKKVFSVLRELAALRPGHVAVILASREISQMREELRSEGILDLPVDIVLRSGRSDTEAELARVAVSNADSVILLSQDRAAGAGADPDVEVIKTLMLLSQADRREGRETRVVGEVSEDRNYEIATIASHKQFPVVSSTQYISRLLVQSARYPGLSKVYDELLQTGGARGGSLHVRNVPEAIDGSFGEAALQLRGALPIGITWPTQEDGRSRTAAALNPEPSYELDDDESLVLLSAGGEYRWDPKPAEATSFSDLQRPVVPAAPRQVLILGRSHMIDEILQELDRHVTEPIAVCVAIDSGQEELENQLRGETLHQLSMHVERGHAVSRSALEALEVGSYDTVFVLADANSTGGDPDARTILTLLLLADLRKNHAAEGWPRVVAEIYDPRNRILLRETQVDDLIVTPEITSILITQISQLPVLAPVYRELLSAGGIEIGLRPVSAYAPLDRTVRFSDLVVACQARLEIALGVLMGGVEAEVLLNPDKSRGFSFGEDDRVIVLAQQRYE